MGSESRKRVKKVLMGLTVSRTTAKKFGRNNWQILTVSYKKS